MLLNLKVYDLTGKLVHEYINFNEDAAEQVYEEFTEGDYTVKVTEQEPLFTLLKQVSRLK